MAWSGSASPSDDVPFPVVSAAPRFPPQALAGGIVVVETRVNADGVPSEVAVIRPAPPFDAAALSTVRAWRFRPARIRGTPASTFVYVVFGFR